MIIKMIDPRNDEVNGRFVELVASVTAIGADIQTGRVTPQQAAPAVLSNIKSIVGRGACGDVGEAEHFLALRAGSGSELTQAPFGPATASAGALPPLG